MKLLNQVLATVLGSLLAFGLGGCECTPKLGQYQVTVRLSDGAFPADFRPFDVDLIGVQASELTRIQSKPVSDYFAASDNYRGTLMIDGAEAVRIPLIFEPGGDNSYTLSLDRKSEIYQRWNRKGVMDLVILADFPDASGSGGADPRRGVLSLDKCKWGRGKQLPDVVIWPGRVETQAPPEKK